MERAACPGGRLRYFEWDVDPPEIRTNGPLEFSRLQPETFAE